MSVYEKNLEFFKKYNQTIFEILTKEQSKYETGIEVVENSMNCVVENKNTRCFIHSIYNINREIQESYNAVNKEVETLCIFGFGFGHSIEYIQNNFKKTEKIIIIEPDLNLFKNILKKLSIHELVRSFRDKSITFIINQDKSYASEVLNSQLAISKTNNIEFVSNVSYRSLYKGYFEKIVENMIKFIRHKKINVSTEDYSKEMWTINNFKNLRIKPDIQIDSFFNKFENKTAILVSAGPSLNKNIHFLKEIQNKAVILAPGSAIKILDSHGIIPDFRLAMDGWDTESKIFKDIDTNSCALVYSNQLNYKILPDYKGKKINMILDTDYLSKYVYKKANINFYEISSGFSISNMTLDIIAKMGFSKVIFMGQDMCYTEGKLYAKGSWSNEEVAIKKGLIRAKDIYENEVYTKDNFLGIKEVFERFIKNNPNIQYINATEGGLGLEGAENKKFSDVLFEDLNDNIKNIENELFYNSDITSYQEEVYNVILQMEKDVKKISKINEERFKKLKKINKYKEKKMGVNKILSELYYMDNFEKSLDEIEFYKKVVKNNLKSTYNSIKMSFRYVGEDKNQMVECLEKMLVGFTSALDEYLSIIIISINEFKGECIKE